MAAPQTKPFTAESRICSECGQQCAVFQGVFDKISQNFYCPGCATDTWIPRGYEDREKYMYDYAYKHPNATRHPSLGVAHLDQRRQQLADSAPAVSRKQRI